MPSVNIRNVNVTLHNGGECSLSWETKDGRYHVWLDMPERAARQVVYKNPLGNPKHSEPGWFATRRLALRSVVNLHMVREAKRIADATDLWTRAKVNADGAERRRREAAEAASVASDREDLTGILRRFVARGMLAEAVATSIIEAVNPEDTNAKA